MTRAPVGSARDEAHNIWLDPCCLESRRDYVRALRCAWCGSHLADDEDASAAGAEEE